jgi:hypothetical protein
MFGKYKTQFILFSILLITFILFLQMSLKIRGLDEYFEKVSFNIKFLYFEIVNQRGWSLIYCCSIFRD